MNQIDKVDLLKFGSRAAWGGVGVYDWEETMDRWCLNTLTLRELRTLSETQQRVFCCPAPAMVHTHCNWSMAAPHGTSVDRLHHLCSMSNRTVLLGMFEETQTHFYSYDCRASVRNTNVLFKTTELKGGYYAKSALYHAIIFHYLKHTQIVVLTHSLM